jgi:serine/threonine-protein kinase HipA
MTMNGKRENFTLGDFKSCANVALMKRGQEKLIITEVLDVVSSWREYAKVAGIAKQTTEKIYRALRLDGFK